MPLAAALYRQGNPPISTKKPRAMSGPRGHLWPATWTTWQNIRPTPYAATLRPLPAVLQSKLLKAIEEKSVRRLVAVVAQRIDVKLVAATVKDLRELVAAGSFRADLYHRLAVVVLHIPALRERAEDVVMLAEHFL